MIRKMLIQIIVLVGVTLAAVACSPKSERHDSDDGDSAKVQHKVYEWKMVTTWPKNFPGLGVGPENLARLTDEMSQGRLKIKVYGAGELVQAFGVFDAVKSGTAQMGHAASYYWRGKVPEAAMFTSVPFGLTAQEMNAWLFHGGGLELWRKLYAAHGLYVFPAGNTGVQMAGWFNRELTTVESLKGLKMRIPGMAGEIFTRLGGQAVTLAGGEIFTSLQTGVVDAAEWVGPYNDLAFGLHKAARYYYYPGWHEPGPTLEATVNLEAYESLPPYLRSILDTATRAVNQDMLDEFTARNRLVLKEMIEVHKVDVRPIPNEILIALYRESRKVFGEMADQSPIGREIYDSILAFQKDVTRYHAVSEEAYLKARRAVIESEGEIGP